MNKERRAELEEVIGLLDDARDRLEEIQSDEQDSFDNLPEGLQFSPRGEKMEMYINMMEDCLSDIDEVKTHVLNVINTK